MQSVNSVPTQADVNFSCELQRLYSWLMQSVNFVSMQAHVTFPYKL